MVSAALALALASPGAAYAQADAPAPFTVRLGERARSLAAVAHPEGGLALQADALADALGGRLVRHPRHPNRYRFEFGAVGLDIEHGSALLIAARDTLPLSASVFRRGATMFVPVALATELLPRLVTGVLFDAQRREIRRFGAVASRQSPAPGPVARHGTRPRIVVVDAGHGGRDKGMSGPIGGGPRVFEKDITLAVAHRLRAALEERAVQVVMTRTTDTLIALADRGRIANEFKGDLFVSIHVNAANPRWRNPGGARGFETYFLAEAKTEDERRVAAMENESVRFETTADVSRDDPLGFIMRDMAQNEHLRESARLAQLVQAGLREVHPGPNRGVKQAGFRVLVSAFMPAVLVEIGFGTNPGEAAYMTSPHRQAELAARLADAVVGYLAEYERKVGG
jgi:N-acetylmuramoyl-L-alanine amidase